LWARGMGKDESGSKRRTRGGGESENGTKKFEPATGRRKRETEEKKKTQTNSFSKRLKKEKRRRGPCELDMPPWYASTGRKIEGEDAEEILRRSKGTRGRSKLKVSHQAGIKKRQGRAAGAPCESVVH